MTMDQIPRMPSRRALGTAQLLEHVARRLLERRDRQDLHPVQWSALRYFARAGRRTATVVGLSRYLGNTSGSTSRTVKVLVDRKLLEVTPSQYDGRSLTFSLTDAGWEALADDPLNEVAAALELLAADDLTGLSGILEQVFAELSRQRRL